MLDCHVLSHGEDAERDAVCKRLCSMELCTLIDGEYVPTIAGESVNSACIDFCIDFEEAHHVTIRFVSDSLEDAEVEAFC